MSVLMEDGWRRWLRKLDRTSWVDCSIKSNGQLGSESSLRLMRLRDTLLGVNRLAQRRMLH